MSHSERGSDIEVCVLSVLSVCWGNVASVGYRVRHSNGINAACQMRLAISFMEAVNGCEKDISYVGAVPCETCKGSGEMPESKKQKCGACKGKGAVRVQLLATSTLSTQVQALCTSMDWSNMTACSWQRIRADALHSK